MAKGHYILTGAGGVVLDLQGCPIPLDYWFDTVAYIQKVMDRRRKFVAASNLPPAEDTLDTIRSCFAPTTWTYRGLKRSLEPGSAG
ncbi:hypothetical protein ACQP1K_02020 [Sphaerimonospora sp. CA-214678]|uniref:hypothetical protein n=1 Tax=Sphaerimonospora sp. CA-214678 TaxID=3240029 RepID=UPI003D8DC052